MSKQYSNFVFFFVAVVLLTGCSGGSKFRIPEPLPDDQKPIPLPEAKTINIAGDWIEKQLTYQIEQSFDLSRQFRNLFGKQKQAMNVDAFGEVKNSSWFTNRNHLYPMAIAEVARGPNRSAGPDTENTWTIYHAKAEGVTPGFRIIDSKNDRYVIKFEPMGYVELGSGAEVVSAKLFYAAGYNVPEYFAIYFDPKILKLGENVELTDEKGRERFMNQDDLNQIMKRVEVLENGKIRVSASKLIDGKGLFVPFKYKGTRKDDPNDIIPHQHRRELRGLRVIAAWLNHFDTKDNNSMDVYTNEGYVKHYLLDFGSTLGSAAMGPITPEVGHQNGFDPHQILLNTLSLGLYVKEWEKSWDIPYPSIGHFISKNFKPEKYKFLIPNPAFENMTDLDGYWAAKIVMSFTDEQLAAVVKEGNYSNRQATSYLVKILAERRNIIGRYWFNKIAPLDRFEILNDGSGQNLCFKDLAITTGLVSSESAQYRHSLRNGNIFLVQTDQVDQSTCIALPSQAVTSNGTEEKGSSKNDYWEMTLQLQRNSSGPWSKWVKIYLDLDSTTSRFQLVGIRRQD